MKTNITKSWLIILAAGMFFLSASRTEAGRMGEIRMTDGTVYRGEIVTQGDLRLVTWAEDELGIETAEDLEEYGGGSIFRRFFGRERTFDLDAVDSIHIGPRPDLVSRELPAERMEQKWDWAQHARHDDERHEISHEKVYIGEPFPVKELQAEVTFTSGETLAGALTRVAFYIYPEGEFTARRFIVRSKEQGEEGESLDDLHHVESIRFFDEGRQFHAEQLIQLKSPVPDDLASVWAVTRRTLTHTPTTPVPDSSDTVKVSGTYGEGLFLAIKKNDTYYVGWRDRADEKLYKAAERHVRELRDYFNERKLLGVYDIEDSYDVLTLVRVRRHIGDERSVRERDPERFGLDPDSSMEFYRISIWRWRYDPETERMILVRRGSFFRKMLPERGMPTPTVIPTEALWIDTGEDEQEHIAIDGELK